LERHNSRSREHRCLLRTYDRQADDRDSPLLASVLVVVISVRSVSMPIVDVIGVVVMLNGLVAAYGSMHMVAVVFCDCVRGFALVPVAIVLMMYMSVVEVIGVVAVVDAGMSTRRVVYVGMAGVRGTVAHRLLRSERLSCSRSTTMVGQVN
jgi:hypothetical protein